jgi:hypothetical protein
MRYGSGAADTHTLAQQAITQADATTKAADAAKSAADTARESLHISERASLVVENPEFRYEHFSIRLPVVNTGHLTSGEVSVVSYLVVRTNGVTLQQSKKRLLAPSLPETIRAG